MSYLKKRSQFADLFFRYAICRSLFLVCCGSQFADLFSWCVVDSKLQISFFGVLWIAICRSFFGVLWIAICRSLFFWCVADRNSGPETGERHIFWESFFGAAPSELLKLGFQTTRKTHIFVPIFLSRSTRSAQKPGSKTRQNTYIFVPIFLSRSTRNCKKNQYFDLFWSPYFLAAPTEVL